jgi:type I restriction enzyme R subunit
VGSSNVEKDQLVITLDPIKRLGTPPEIIKAFGGLSSYEDAIHELTTHLYQIA